VSIPTPSLSCSYATATNGISQKYIYL
jgi:hypothetical protein